MIKPVQSKMARAALGWSTKDLARHAGVGLATITRFENSQAATIPATIKAMQQAFEEHGVRFSSRGWVCAPAAENDGSGGEPTKPIRATEDA